MSGRERKSVKDVETSKAAGSGKCPHPVFAIDTL
jgi:hypothetical protein